MKVYANENLEEMSFISVNFSTLFYKRNRKLSPTLKGTRESAKRIGYHRVFYAPLVCYSSWVFFFCLQAALVTNTLPTSIFVSYYCRMSSSDSEKGEIEISLVVVGTPKLRQKDDNTDFHGFLSEIWKLGNNRQTAYYELTIGQLPIIEKLPINQPNRLIGSSLVLWLWPLSSWKYFEWP